MITYIKQHRKPTTWNYDTRLVCDFANTQTNLFRIDFSTFVSSHLTFFPQRIFNLLGILWKEIRTFRSMWEHNKPQTRFRVNSLILQRRCKRVIIGTPNCQHWHNGRNEKLEVSNIEDFLPYKNLRFQL